MTMPGSIEVTPVLAQENLVYVPVDPCRIVDTRVAGGAIPANTSRNFLVSGAVTGQGGTAAGCEAPRQETKPLAISAYVLAVPATGSAAGVLTAYPSDQVAPAIGEGSTVNFAAGEVVGNTTNISLCEPSSCPSDGEFAILARNTNQHVVVDVQGYFYPSTAATMVLKDGNGVQFGKVLTVGVDYEWQGFNLLLTVGSTSIVPTNGSSEINVYIHEMSDCSDGPWARRLDFQELDRPSFIPSYDQVTFIRISSPSPTGGYTFDTFKIMERTSQTPTNITRVAQSDPSTGECVAGGIPRQEEVFGIREITPDFGLDHPPPYVLEIDK